MSRFGAAAADQISKFPLRIYLSIMVLWIIISKNITSRLGRVVKYYLDSSTTHPPSSLPLSQRTSKLAQLCTHCQHDDRDRSNLANILALSLAGSTHRERRRCGASVGSSRSQKEQKAR